MSFIPREIYTIDLDTSQVERKVAYMQGFVQQQTNKMNLDVEAAGRRALRTLSTVMNVVTIFEFAIGESIDVTLLQTIQMGIASALTLSAIAKGMFAAGNIGQAMAIELMVGFIASTLMTVESMRARMAAEMDRKIRANNETIYREFDY